MMRNIIKYSAVLLLACAALSGCQKFTEPEPSQPANLNPTMTLEEFKALYTGSATEITDASIVLEAKVVSSDRSGNLYRSLYVDDGTAGLELKIYRSGLYNYYKMGQTLYIKPKGLFLGSYNESIQLGSRAYDEQYQTTWISAQSLIDATIFPGEHGEPVPPIDITEGTQLNDDLICRYVRVLGLSYQGGDRGLQTWAIPSDPVTGDQPDEGNQNFQLDDMTIVVRSSGYASFAGAKLIDMGLDIGTKCNISGILTKYGKTYQLVLLDLDGVEVLD